MYILYFLYLSLSIYIEINIDMDIDTDYHDCHAYTICVVIDVISNAV